MQRIEAHVKKDRQNDPLLLRNPLDAFTTYSTHFVILAARTTENARAFINPAAGAATLDAINRTEALGDAVPYNSGTARGDVFLVMDTRRFSQFTVQSMKHEVLINGLAKGHAHSNLATTIEMTILDSVGISFINFLQWLMDTKLQTNFDGMIFLIRTIFVGHKEDGTTETVQSITIPAHLFKLEVNLDFAKGIYTVEFMPNMNFSVFQHNRWLHIGTATTFGSITGNKLGEMVRGFEAELNRVSAAFYSTATEKITSAGKPPVETTGKYGRKVSYLITLPKDWEELDFLGSWKHNADGSIERIFKDELAKLDASKAPPKDSASNVANPSSSSNVSVNWGSTITEVLDIIFKQCKGVADFANAEKTSDPNGVAKFYKHVVSLTSNDEEVIVHVDVVAFAVPNVQLQQQKSASDGATVVNSEYYVTVVEGGVTRQVPRNYFELDYIFTGTNSQVLNFDMKIQNLVFLLAANVKVSEGQMSYKLVGNDISENADARKPAPEILSMRPYDPLLLPMQTALQATNFSVSSAISRNPEAQQAANSSMQEYARNLSAFYAISPIQTSLTIKGNPELMLKVSPPDLPEHRPVFTQTGGATTSRANEDERATYRKDFEDRILNLAGKNVSGQQGGVFILNKQLGDSSYMSSPVFARINVLGPNVDFRTNKLVEGLDFASKVLVENYYILFKITNIIEQGVFTQEMELWSHNVFGANKLSQETGRKPGQVAK